jgi:hypothetical protein
VNHLTKTLIAALVALSTFAAAGHAAPLETGGTPAEVLRYADDELTNSSGQDVDYRLSGGGASITEPLDPELESGLTLLCALEMWIDRVIGAITDSSK